MLHAPPAAPQAEPKFDLATHKRDKYGRVLQINPYRLHVIDGLKGFERPVGSGNLWYENNEPMGRLKEVVDEKTKKVTRSFEIGAPHVEYVPPLTADQKIAQENAEQKTKNAALESELAQLKAEQAAERKAFEERLAKLEAKGAANEAPKNENKSAQAEKQGR